MMELPVPPVSVAIVDDDPYVRSALAAVLSATDSLSLFGSYADGEEIVEERRLDADVVLMDARMPRMNGIRATERLKRRTNSPGVIMLTTFDLDDEIAEALRVGAAGYLLKDTEPQDLIAAIHKVALGETILSSSIVRQLVELARSGAERRRSARERLGTLSPRENEVACAIGSGKANSEISEELDISLATVETQVSSIFTKLGVTSRLQVALIVHDAQGR